MRVALDKSVNELCCGGFFFSLQVLNVLRILGGGRIFLDDTGDQVLLLFGGRGVVYACRELFNALASAHVFYKIPRFGGVSDVPTYKIIFAILRFLIPVGFFKGDNAIAIAYLMGAFIVK